MWFFANPLAYLVYVAIGFWLVCIWIPHRIHVMRIGFKYGWARQKHTAIIKLFREDEIYSVGYTGASCNPRQECSLVISGPWGQYVRSGVGNDLEYEKGSVMPPLGVAMAFDGYINHPGDVVYLLCYVPFIERLRKEVPDVLSSDVWNMETFALYKKDCPFVVEVGEDDPLKNTLLQVEQ